MKNIVMILAILLSVPVYGATEKERVEAGQFLDILALAGTASVCLTLKDLYIFIDGESREAKEAVMRFMDKQSEIANMSSDEYLEMCFEKIDDFEFLYRGIENRLKE